MASITAPYSLELEGDGDAVAVVAGTTVTAVTGKAKIFLGSAVPPSRRQSIQGSIKAVLARLLEAAKAAPNSADLVAYGPWASASSGNITLGTSTAGVGTGDVAVVLDSAFLPNWTHRADETVNELLQVLLENSAGN